MVFCTIKRKPCSVKQNDDSAVAEHGRLRMRCCFCGVSELERGAHVKLPACQIVWHGVLLAGDVGNPII